MNTATHTNGYNTLEVLSVHTDERSKHVTDRVERSKRVSTTCMRRGFHANFDMCDFTLSLSLSLSLISELNLVHLQKNDSG